MQTQKTRFPQNRAMIRVTSKLDEETDCRVTRVRINGRVDVGTLERWLVFWTAGREVHVGPLSRDQAEKLAEDLAYDSVG
jgi:hypothetical protein